MWGQLRIILGRHLKIRGDWEKFKYEREYKISWGLIKIEGARLSGGLLQSGVSDNDLCSACHVYPLSRAAWIISILFILKRFTWGLNYII